MPELPTTTNNLFRFLFCLITLICACITWAAVYIIESVDSISRDGPDVT